MLEEFEILPGKCSFIAVEEDSPSPYSLQSFFSTKNHDVSTLYRYWASLGDSW